MSSILKALQRLQGERGGAGAQPALRDDLARELTAQRAELAGAAPPEEAPPPARWPLLAIVAGLALAAVAVAGFFAAGTLGRTPPPVAVAPPPAPAAVEPDPAAAPAEGEPRMRDALPARPSAPPEEAPTLPASVVAASEGAPASEPDVAAEQAVAAGSPPAPAPIAPAPGVAIAVAPAPLPAALAAAPPPAVSTVPAAAAPAPAQGAPVAQAAPAAPTAPAAPSAASEPAAPAGTPPAPLPRARVETPHIELAEPGALPPALAAAPPAAEAAAPPAFEAAPSHEVIDEPAPRRREPDFAVVTPPPEIAVLRTSWHPRPERRIARVRLAGTSAPVEVHEGDAISTLVVKAIEPSGVVFLHGGRELRRGVGGE